MKSEICAVYDSATQTFGRPFFVVHTGQAVRSFKDETNRKDADFNRHPSDYTLYHLGSFHDENAVFDLLPNPEQLIRGKDAIEGEKA